MLFPRIWFFKVQKNLMHLLFWVGGSKLKINVQKRSFYANFLLLKSTNLKCKYRKANCDCKGISVRRVNWQQESISSTHWRKAQMCRCIELGPKDAVLFHQHNCLQLYQCKELEAMPIFYAADTSLFTRKFNINLLIKKLPLEHWWKCHQHR